MKSKGIAYLLWFLGMFGILGFHRFYLGKIGTGILWFFTGGLFGLGALIDLFTLGSKVDQYNTKEELRILRETALFNAEANVLNAQANMLNGQVNFQPNVQYNPNPKGQNRYFEDDDNQYV